ncbi:hypothetical protein Sjap_006289 [Stephania japonica]|uniref:Uncharacterized protein n=1 Tax=Stephania japonica TaxID=461633 RepID=A0AAP0K5I0_9MAGN
MGQQASKNELVFQHAGAGNVEAIKALHREGASLEVDMLGVLYIIQQKEALTKWLNYFLPMEVRWVNAMNPISCCYIAVKLKALLELAIAIAIGTSNRKLSTDSTLVSSVDKRKFVATVHVFHEIKCTSSVKSILWRPNSISPLQTHTCIQECYRYFIHMCVALSVGAWKTYCPAQSSSALIGDALPFATIPLWKASIEEPMFHQSDPTIIISGKTATLCTRHVRVCECGLTMRHLSITPSPSFDLLITAGTQVKLSPANEGDRQQLQCFYNACRGIRQVRQSSSSHETHVPMVPGPAPAPVPSN